MGLTVERHEGSVERRILTGMIVDDDALGRIVPKWVKEGLFRSSWANLVGGWCADYYERHQQSPGDDIVALFESWASDAHDDDTTKLVERFLETLSDEYESLADESNPNLVIDLASKHFNEVAAEKLSESIKGDLSVGKLDKALKRIEKFRQVEVGASLGINVLDNTAAIRQAFKNKAKPVITFKGALGNFFGNHLERDGFIGIMAPEKRGKTWWLQHFAWESTLQGRRVAFFGVGDMTEGQMMLRFMTRVLRRPLIATEEGKPIKYPKTIKKHPDETFASVEHDIREYADNLSWRDARAACRKLLRKRQIEPDALKLACYPNSSITVSGISSVVETWDRSGWGTPDVVCVDYADILAPPTGIVESRHQINATWKGLRRLSQEFHCLVITATQSDADSYDAETIGRMNFSEDKRKFAEVTGMFGISQTSDEKSAGVQRLNWLVLREGEFFENQCVHVAGCFGAANPAILSTF